MSDINNEQEIEKEIKKHTKSLKTGSYEHHPSRDLKRFYSGEEEQIDYAKALKYLHTQQVQRRGSSVAEKRIFSETIGSCFAESIELDPGCEPESKNIKRLLKDPDVKGSYILRQMFGDDSVILYEIRVNEFQQKEREINLIKQLMSRLSSQNHVMELVESLISGEMDILSKLRSLKTQCDSVRNDLKDILSIHQSKMLKYHSLHEIVTEEMVGAELLKTALIINAVFKDEEGNEGTERISSENHRILNKYTASFLLPFLMVETSKILQKDFMLNIDEAVRVSTEAGMNPAYQF